MGETAFTDSVHSHLCRLDLKEEEEDGKSLELNDYSNMCLFLSLFCSADATGPLFG